MNDQPRDDWGGEGLLGLSIRFDPITVREWGLASVGSVSEFVFLQDMSDQCWAVLSVEANSPAAAAGLIPSSGNISRVLVCFA